MLFDCSSRIFWKSQKGGDSRRRRGWQGLRGGEGCLGGAQRIFTAVRVGTCHFTLVQTQRMEQPKSEAECQLWTLGDNDVSR